MDVKDGVGEALTTPAYPGSAFRSARSEDTSLNSNQAQAEDDVRHMLRVLSEEMHASLTLSCAAVARLGGDGAAAEESLTRELERARRLVRSRRTVAMLDRVQRSLQAMPDDQQREDALTGALIFAPREPRAPWADLN